MANYETHKKVGFFSTLVAITAVYVASFIINLPNAFHINLQTIFFMIFFGTIGSLAPDLDLANSSPSKIFKRSLYFLGTLSSIILIFTNPLLLEPVGITDKWLIIPSFIILSLFLVLVFTKSFDIITIHRGVFHSIPFAGVLSLFIYDLFHYGQLLYSLNLNSLLISSIFFFGFLVHLILDEIYSFDFSNRRIKRSFGSAFKIIDYKNLLGSFFLISLLIVSFHIKGVFTFSDWEMLLNQFIRFVLHNQFTNFIHHELISFIKNWSR